MIYSRRFTALAGCILCCVLYTGAFAQDAVIVRRAAFDIGSASIKCTIADVDIVSGRVVKVVEELTRKVDFAEDMARSYDGNLSKEIMSKGVAVLKEFKLIAMDRRAVELTAAGGTGFRSARNGRAYFVMINDEVGIPCRIISQQQEALLSYHAVRIALDSLGVSLLVWDIGGGSMQMTARNLDGGLTFHLDNLASVSFKNSVIDIIQEKNSNTIFTPNPVTEDQVERALEYVRAHVRMTVPPPLAARIKNGDFRIVGIGGVFYYALPESLGGRKGAYTQEEVAQGVAEWTGKTDKDFKSEYANTRLTNLILVLGYMQTLGIDSVAPLKINQADGLLVAPEFW